MHKPELDLRGDEGSLASYNEGLRYVKRETDPRGFAILHQGIGEHYLSKARLGEVLGGLENQFNSVIHYNLAVKYFTIALEVLDEHLEDYCQTSYFLYKAYLGLRKFQAADEIYQKGIAAFRQLYNQANSIHEWRKLKARYSQFSSVKVDRLVQTGQLESALEVAERAKNSRITWILEAQNCKVLSPS